MPQVGKRAPKLLSCFILCICLVATLFFYWNGSLTVGIHKPEAYQRRKVHQSREFTGRPERSGRPSHISANIWKRFYWDRVPAEWVEIINERRKRLAQMCKDHNQPINVDSPIIVPKSWIPDRNFVDDINGVILCPISKTASRSWIKTYFKLNRQMNTSLEHNDMPQPYFESYVRKLRTHTEFGIKARLNSYLKIMTVRHPLARLVSVYKEQIHQERNHIRKRLDAFLTNSTEEKHRNGTKGTPSFQDFVRFALSQMNDNHWKKFDKFCGPCKIQYDLIVHYETLEDDAKNTLRLLGADDKIDLPPSHLSTSSSDGSSSDSQLRVFFSTVDKYLVMKLIDEYGDEPKYFGYDMNISAIM